MTERKKSGFVIEMMIIFMLITFGFCILITTVIMGLNSERKYAHANIQMQTDLNQIGEYYLRYIQQSGNQFPTGNETAKADFSSFNWMGEDTIDQTSGETLNDIKEFFIRANNKYNYSTYYSLKRGGIFDFFQTQAIWRKIVVTSKEDGKIKLIVELTETRDDKTVSSLANYNIKTWSIGVELTDTTADDYKEDDITILQILWKLIGKNLAAMRKMFQGLQYEGVENTFENFWEAGNEVFELWLKTYIK